MRAQSTGGVEINSMHVHRHLQKIIKSAFIYAYAKTKTKGKINANFVIIAGRVRSDYKKYANEFLYKKP